MRISKPSAHEGIYLIVLAQGVACVPLRTRRLREI
jgi:hypothetical protein